MTGAESEMPRLPKAWGWGLGLAAAAALVALVLGAPRTTAQDGLWTPDGYTRVVNEIYAANGWIEFAEEIELDGEVIRLSDAGAALEPVRAYAERSFLLRDLADPAAWTMGGDQRPALAPTRRNYRLPFARIQAWRGDILFADSVDASLTLVGPGGAFAFSPRLTPAGDTDSPPGQILIGGTGHTADGPHPAYDLRATAGGSPIARVFMLGDALVVLGWPSARVQVIVDGERINDDLSAGYGVLDPGAALVIRGRSFPPVQYVAMSGDREISRHQMLADRRRHPTTRGLALSLEAAMTQRAADGDQDLINEDLRLTLDSGIHDAAQTELSTRMEGLRMGALPTGRATFRAGLTVLDITSGDLVALASYPAEESHLDAATLRMPGDRLDRVNQNFRTMAPGSAAKPLFAAAIVGTPGMGNLLSLEIQADPEGRDLLGVGLTRPLNDTYGGGGDGWITFDEFLVHSSNRYAAALLLLASAPDPFTFDGPETPESWRIGGQSISRLPRTLFPIIEDQQGLSFGAASPPLSASLPWMGRMARLFDLPETEAVREHADARRPGAVGELRGLSSRTYDTAFWSDLSGSAPDADYGGFATITPQHEQLRFNLISEFRGEYVSTILGSGSSRWTNIKLAEAYARLVTGARVRAGLLAGARGADPLDFGAGRSEVLAALARVPDAPANAALRPVLASLRAEAQADGEELRVFAKTGTPPLPAARSPAATAVTALIRARVVRLDGDNRLRVARQNGTGSGAVIQALRRDRLARQTAEEGELSLEAIANYIDRLNRMRLPDRMNRLEFRGGRLDAIAPNLQDQTGSVLAIVVARYAPGSDRPLRGFSLVVNIEGRADGQRAAVEAAAAVLNSPALRARLARPRSAEQAA